MDEEFLKAQKLKLLKKKQHLEEQIQKLTKNAEGKELKYPEYGSSEEDSITEVEDLEENADLEGDFIDQLKKVKKALAKIETGKYGISEKTNQPIARSRLEAYPEAESEIN